MRSIAVATLAVVLGAVAPAWATPSTQIWIPSTDTQQFATLHLNYDVYARPERIPMLVLGPTVGVLPWKAVQAEVGFDLMFQGNSALDAYPIYFHGKLGTPEDALFHGQPALAVGVYNVGVRRASDVNTMQNVGYAELARTLPYVGRLSVGYYLGNAAVLRVPVAASLEGATRPDNRGFLASWDRKMPEISEKLWLAVDYQQGENALGAINGGFAWSFTKDISLLVGYDHYWNVATAGKDTFTVQLDITLFAPEEQPKPTEPTAP